jgi:hypothetical protein
MPQAACLLAWLNLPTLQMRRQVLPKQQLPFTELHGSMWQKAEIFIDIAATMNELHSAWHSVP